MEDLPVCQPHNRHWFWHGEQILDLLDLHRPVVCVELGTWKGCSAIAVARLVKQWHGSVTCVDVWELENVMGDFTPVTLAECRENVRAAGLTNVFYVQARTDIAAAQWTRGPIDYLYIDAGHSFDDCSRDLESWWPHLRIGGLIAGDDYDDPRQGVTRAWDAFELRHDQQFERPKPYDLGMGTRLIYGIKQ